MADELVQNPPDPAMAVALDPRRLLGFRLAVDDCTLAGAQTGLKMGDKGGGKLFGGNAGIRKKRV